MPAISWTATAPSGSDQPCTVLAVHLSLRTGADAAPLRTWLARLGPALAQTPDLLGHGHALGPHDLLVVSAWARRASLAAFDRSPAHARAKRELHGLLLPPVLVLWSTRSTSLPPEAQDVWARIGEASRRANSPDT